MLLTVGMSALVPDHGLPSRPLTMQAEHVECEPTCNFSDVSLSIQECSALLSLTVVGLLCLFSFSTG